MPPLTTLRVLRERRGLTQEGLADAAGLTRVFITRLEGGQNESVRKKDMRRLALALGISMAELAVLLFLDDDPSRPTTTSAPAD